MRRPAAVRRQPRNLADHRLDRLHLRPRRGLGFYARHAKRKAAHNDWIFRNGIRGSATVVAVGNSHTTVNEMPLMKLQLQLDFPGAGSREVSRREVMPVFTANRMQAGLVLPAYANPRNPAEFILVW